MSELEKRTFLVILEFMYEEIKEVRGKSKNIEKIEKLLDDLRRLIAPHEYEDEEV